jgi:hypothetical protein
LKVNHHDRFISHDPGIMSGRQQGYISPTFTLWSNLPYSTGQAFPFPGHSKAPNFPLPEFFHSFREEREGVISSGCGFGFSLKGKFPFKIQKKMLYFSPN